MSNSGSEDRNRTRSDLQARAHRQVTSIGVFIGLGITVFGAILLLDQEGIVSAGHLLRFWPVLLIAWGLAGVLRAERTEEWLWSVLLTLLGVVFQLGALGYHHFDIEHVWPFLVIAAGVWTLLKSLQGRRSWSERDNTVDWSHLDLNRIDVFGGGKVRVTSKNFLGGRWVAVFGGSQVDLTQAEIQGNDATIDILAVFGGGEIIVPREWQVDVRGTAFFGGHNDETRPPLSESGGPRKKLFITGAWVFGGFNIKN